MDIKETNSRDSREKISRIQNIIAMAIFGTMSLLVKNIPLPSREIALYRGLIAFVVLFLIILLTGRFKHLQQMKQHLGKLFIAGGAMGFNWILLFEAYRHTTVALSTLSYYFAPTLMVIGSGLILKEKLTPKQILCFLGSTGGIILIIGVTGGGSNDMAGILYGLGAACLYTTVIMFNKTMGNVDGILRTWILFAAAILVLTPYVYFTGGFHFSQLSGMGLGSLLTLGIFHTGIIYFLYFTSIVHLKGQQVAILSYIDPLVAILISVFILGEAITPVQLAGGMMILLFTILNELKLKELFSKNPYKPARDPSMP